MNFFRSEEHLRNWEGFKEKKKGGIISLNTLMQLFSGPYFTNRRNPDYFSHMGEYTSDMLILLNKLENAGDYWRLNRLEKVGFYIGEKLGII
ncbi:MAG: hypothetical protein SVZ03_04270 [Spirochaetota bacterium]|nr:hypothetical protein [Spirochaetota bacterium]